MTWKLSCRGFDDEMRAVVARNLEGRGINMHPCTTLTEVLKFCWLCKPVRLKTLLVILFKGDCIALFQHFRICHVPCATLAKVLKILLAMSLCKVTDYIDTSVKRIALFENARIVILSF